MIRRFNYTNRLRISRSDIRIILREENGAFTFDADLRALSEYDLPLDSFVFVEAYRQANWMRFDFGQIGAITPTPNRFLSQFDSIDGVRFRVKVSPNSDTHTLLAEADQIPLTHPEQSESEKVPLLSVWPKKLGDDVYRLDFSEGPPLLLINSEIGDHAEIGLSPIFVSLVYPAVLREILIRILLLEKYDDDSDPEEWQSQWIRFATLNRGLGELPPPDELDERELWIEKAVSVFSKHLQIRAKFTNFWSGEK